jgi:hypothetical protein
MVTAHADHPQRGAFEGFIEARFAKAYGARIETHYPLIAGLTHPDGAVLAAAGVRFAETKPLFLERYLDQPIDQALAGAFGRPVVRDEVVEIGSLAADGAATTLDLFTRLANWLALDGRRRIAVATVRPELARLLIHSGFNLRLVGAAAAERLGDEAAQWGSYYDRGPQVFAGEVGCSPVLPQLRQRLEAKGMAREVRRLRRMAS